MTQIEFGFRSRNPDVLTCIANLSNDVVFTPPPIATLVLDGLEQAWAEGNSGASIWADPDVTFLDPASKSGVFLREITRRLTHGLETEIPDLQKRVEHILTKQVFGIATETLTSLVSRRSVYCSKQADGPHSVARTFTSPAGNIWFERTEHTWVGGRQRVLTTDTDGKTYERSIDGKCLYCGATQRDYDRDATLESHAYAFIHAADVRSRIAELFGANLHFDVIIGNPPYQLGSSGGEAVGSFAMPIYQKFVEAAKGLDPRYLTMITPSRWFAGGRNLGEFRDAMLKDRRVRSLVDYPDSRDVFDGVDIAGGVSYFLWDSSWSGKCQVTTVTGPNERSTMARYLDEFDVLVRYNEAVSIIEQVRTVTDGRPFQSLASSVSPIQPFSIRTHYRGAPTPAGMKDPVLLYQSGGTGYIERSAVPRNLAWVDQWTVFLSRTASEHGGQTDKAGTRRVFSRIMVGGPGTACTETYLVAGRFDAEEQAENYAAYLRTRFVRFLVSLRTNTQDLYSERFAFVPDLPMDRRWHDTDLYARYGLTPEQVDFIEATIKPMSEANE